jgi:hypothetical protein
MSDNGVLLVSFDEDRSQPALEGWFLSSSGIPSDLSISTISLGQRHESVISGQGIARIGVCVAVFALLVGWAIVFPYTGDGDSVLHYLNARDATVTPVSGLHAWARPMAKLVMLPFAMHGIMATRAAMALVAAMVAWQTIRLAEELELPHPLLAGPMILWQPLAFAVAADTMTEMPMALGIVAAIRLWRNGYLRTCALLIGFLPAVRPEGFFLGVLWGVMILRMITPGNTLRVRAIWRGATLSLMTVGLLSWAVACWAMTDNHDVLYVLHIWNWPPGSYAGYGRGSILHHVIRWPLYCGVPMTVLFALGLRPSFRQKAMELPWAVWLLVFGLHSVLFWRGWFASCGLMRILACTSPITALVCLYGWNAAEMWLRSLSQDRAAGTRWNSAAQHWRFVGRVLSPRTAGVIGIVLCTGYSLVSYALMSSHYDCFPMARCVDYIRDRSLLQADTWFFAGNQMATAQLDLPGRAPRVMERPCAPEEIRRKLAELPIGSIGVWDDRQAVVWHGHRISDLSGHGFTVLYDTCFWAPSCKWIWLGARGSVPLRYVVLRKDGPFLEQRSPEIVR